MMQGSRIVVSAVVKPPRESLLCSYLGNEAVETTVGIFVSSAYHSRVIDSSGFSICRAGDTERHESVRVLPNKAKLIRAADDHPAVVNSVNIEIRLIRSVDGIRDCSIGIAQKHVAVCRPYHFAEIVNVTCDTGGIVDELDRNKGAADIGKGMIDATATAYGIAADEVADIVIPEDRSSHGTGGIVSGVDAIGEQKAVTSEAVRVVSTNDVRVINSKGLSIMPRRTFERGTELAIRPAIEPKKGECALADLDRPAADDFAAITDLTHRFDAKIGVGVIEGRDEIDRDGIGLGHG